jgi:ABC-2 type transport system ATP-binding protein
LSTLSFVNVSARRWGPLNASLSSGLHVIVSDDPLALADLVEVASGMASARGSVFLDGADVAESPAARRRIASLQAREILLPARTTSESVALALEAYGAAPKDDLLARAGLARLAELAPEALGHAARRAIAFTVALEVTALDALVLYDPLALETQLPREHIVSACRERAERAVVIVATPQLDDAAAFGGALFVIAGGRLCPSASLTGAVSHDTNLMVRSLDAARLTDLLRADATLSVHFDAQRSKHEFFVRGADVTSTARIVLSTAWQNGLELTAISPVFSELTPLLAGQHALQTCLARVEGSAK